MDALPKVPTDSLYKLMAVFGLVIAVGCFYAARSFEYLVANKAAELNPFLAQYWQAMEKFGHDTRKYAAQEGDKDPATAKRLDSIVSNFIRNASPQTYFMYLKPEERADYRKMAFEFHEALTGTYPNEILNSDAAGVRNASTEIQVRLNHIWYLVDLNRTVSWWSWIGSTTGVILTFSGFALWYRKIQRHEDWLLFYNAEAKRHEWQTKAIGNSP